LIFSLSINNTSGPIFGCGLDCKAAFYLSEPGPDRAFKESLHSFLCEVGLVIAWEILRGFAGQK